MLLVLLNWSMSVLGMLHASHLNSVKSTIQWQSIFACQLMMLPMKYAHTNAACSYLLLHWFLHTVVRLLQHDLKHLRLTVACPCTLAQLTWLGEPDGLACVCIC